MIGITLDTTAIEAHIDMLYVQMEQRAKRACERWAVELVAHAKASHPWQNRTGDTEATTKATVEEMQDRLVTLVYAETPYSKFLELAHEGRWSWLYPSVKAMEPRFYRILGEEFTHVGGLGGISSALEATA
jgi:hypothetical protein